jgi:predicted ATP-dependent endonuclease of OLD family
MSRFRIQNYKKVQDTGWIDCLDLTVFVGKNESGKSSIFRGLSKLNPSDGEKYDGLKEFPRRRYASEFKAHDWPVASVEFTLADDEKKEINDMSPLLKDSTKISCTRHYSWTLDVEFIPTPNLPVVTNQRFLTLLNKWQTDLQTATAPDGKGEALASIKLKLLPFFSEKVKQLQTAKSDGLVNEALVSETVNMESSQMNEVWQKEIFKAGTEELNQVKTSRAALSQLNNARAWVLNHLPKFVYFDRYDVIDSAVHLPTFIQQMRTTPPLPRARSTKALFQHVGLDIDKLLQLDPTQPNKAAEELKRFADERAILMSSASDAMTKRFSEWWEQRKHRFSYRTDGPFFRVWVSDDLDSSEIELDQRSAGMQYFFSFYLVFLEETKDAYSNSILLLDEAGLQLHGTAQQKIVKFLKKISKDNQLLYTTHSPFMIDGDNLETVRVVYEDAIDGTSKVSSEVWPKDRDSLFPLQAALGYSIAQTLFYSKRQLVVEGITDYFILKAMNELLSSMKRETLRNDAIIVPAGGVSKLMPLAAMLTGQGVEIRVLLDGDDPGIQKGKEIKNKLLIESFFVSSYSGGKGTDIEDLFPEDIYADAVKQAYKLKDLPLDESTTATSVVSKVEIALKKVGINTLEKWKPVLILTDWIRVAPDKIPETTISAFYSIFKDVNSSWSE